MNRTTLSTIATLGNRLSAKMGRSAGFKRAWELVRQQFIQMHVAGVSIGRRPEALRRLTMYAPEAVKLFIARESDNPFDKNALAVLAGVQNGRGLCRIGYLPAATAAVLSVLLDHGKAIKVRLLSIGGTYALGATIELKIA